ncbi:MAG: NUDIX hydrolase [Ignavibacteria bacterium]|nr:NUDIX hydrolase [Ignavibacteria bacterium]
MKLKKWKKLATELKFTNYWWSYKIDKYTLPNGTEGEYHYAFTHGSVFIIPVTTGGKIIMVEQYRYLNDRFSIEFPGGGVKNEDGHDLQAEKELVEETGFNGELKYAAMFNPFNGVTNEICKIYIARNLTCSNMFKKDNSEEFILHEFTPSEIDEMISSNIIYDGMTLASWALVKNKL